MSSESSLYRILCADHFQAGSEALNRLVNLLNEGKV